MSGKCLCSWSFSNSVPCNRGFHIPTAKKSQAFYLCLSKTDTSNCPSFIYYNWESCFLGDSEICLSIDLFFKDKYKRVTKKNNFPELWAVLPEQGNLLWIYQHQLAKNTIT